MLRGKWRYLLLRSCTSPCVKLRPLPCETTNRLIVEAIELDILVDSIFVLLLVDHPIVDLDLLPDLAILLLLQHQLLHEHAPLLLLCTVLRTQLLVLLQQGPVLIVDTLRNVGDELEMMLKFGLAFLLISTGVSFAGLALLHLLLHLG